MIMFKNFVEVFYSLRKLLMYFIMVKALTKISFLIYFSASCLRDFFKTMFNFRKYSRFKFKNSEFLFHLLLLRPFYIPDPLPPSSFPLPNLCQPATGSHVTHHPPTHLSPVLSSPFLHLI